MSLSQPSAKKPKLSSEEKQISDLSDADLAAILERLPPYDRLIASEVCRRWHALSRKEWLDVNYLDLSPIPGKQIAAIVRQCPNLRSVFAVKKSFDLNELVSLSNSTKLSMVKLYDCCFAYRSIVYPLLLKADFQQVFSRNLWRTTWNELILHNALLDDNAVLAPAGSENFSRGLSFAWLPGSLTRLQLTGLRLRNGARYFCHPVMFGLGTGLRNLECLILHDTPESAADNAQDSVDLLGRSFDYNFLIFNEICALTNLTELCVSPAHSLANRNICAARFRDLMAGLPKLAVLFLGEVDVEMLASELAKLISDNAVLRILVLAGSTYRPIPGPGEPDLQPIELPARKRFPHGFGSDPLPLLHIFVGKSASEHLRFAQSASDAALIHFIDAPMPQFLEREDIAPIFEGCWIAEKIKETARNGGKLWEYELDACVSSAAHL